MSVEKVENQKEDLNDVEIEQALSSESNDTSNQKNKSEQTVNNTVKPQKENQSTSEDISKNEVPEKKDETTEQNTDNSSQKLDDSKSFKQAIAKFSMWNQIVKIFENILLSIIAIIALAFTVFTIANTDNSKISSGISILGVDVSGLNREEAINKVGSYFQDNLKNNDVILKHNEFETNIGTEQIEVRVDVLSSINSAFEIGSGNNIFSNSFKKIALIVKPVDIKPSITINTKQLNTALSDISTQLPDSIKQSDYYIDGKNLIVTSGKSGAVIDNDSMVQIITEKINDLSYINNPIDIITINKEPDAPNIENIYSEVYKEPANAHYDSQTHIVYPEENGLDFAISVDEAKAILTEQKEEYTIPLKVLYPAVTTNMIGMEAFPDLLSTFSTRYPASNRDRTTNLRLAASKINGFVLLPGQTFSYNTVVGERTIAGGYKEAAIYQDGQVVQGLGGGICQISTTLYNAALYANLEIVERRNHQFVPSYVGAGRDATVVYGSQDFKFKNTRNYAIKIICSVDSGVATFSLYGLAEENDCEVIISSGITSRGANSLTSATYRTLKRNGQVISTETVSRDTYKVH